MSDNLGRLIAAEKNALSAIESSRIVEEKVQKLQGRLNEMDRANRQLTEKIQALQVQLAMSFGTGPTG